MSIKVAINHGAFNSTSLMIDATSAIKELKCVIAELIFGGDSYLRFELSDINDNILSNTEIISDFAVKEFTVMEPLMPQTYVKYNDEWVNHNFDTSDNLKKRVAEYLNLKSDTFRLKQIYSDYIVEIDETK